MKKYIGLICFITNCIFGWSPPQYRLLQTSKHQQSIAYVFAHGLGSNYTQAKKILNPLGNESILCGPTAVFNFPDAKPSPSEYHNKHVNLGQSRDIERLSYACNQTIKQVPDCQGIILVGISRGSATILNYAAQNKHMPIKAIVAEALATVSNELTVKTLASAEYKGLFTQLQANMTELQKLLR